MDYICNNDDGNNKCEMHKEAFCKFKTRKLNKFPKKKKEKSHQLLFCLQPSLICVTKKSLYTCNLDE